MKLPCKGCITYPICRSKYINEVGGMGHFQGLLKPIVMKIMVDKCSLLKSYVLFDKFCNAKYKITKWITKRIGMNRCERIHKYMLKEIE